MSHYPAKGTWTACRFCGRHVHHSQWGPFKQCPYCHHWRRLTAQQRLDLLVDPNSWRALPMPERPVNDLNFPDYQQKLTRAADQTTADEAVVTGCAMIDRHPVVLAVMDSYFMMGTLNTVVTRRILAASRYARTHGLPLMIITASGGARMQEGLYALVGMNLILAELARLAAVPLPLITVLTDPTMGGVSASFAFKGDVIVAEAGAKIGFAGARVIQQTMPVDLPPDFQTAASLFDHGMLDAVVERPRLRNYLAKVLASYDRKGDVDHG